MRGVFTIQLAVSVYAEDALALRVPIELRSVHVVPGGAVGASATGFR